jgi:hypothetical protein
MQPSSAARRLRRASGDVRLNSFTFSAQRNRITMRLSHYVPILAIGAVACGLTACSADDTANPEDSGVDQSTADASVDSGVDAAKDAAKDSTIVDAQPDVAKDTGADVTTDGASDGATDGGDAGDGGDGGLPPTGSPCNQPNAVQQQDCGLCGFQKRACLPSDGGYAWGDWGFCQNQVVNGCDPKVSYPDTACGNCGTKKTVCLNNCNYDVTQTCTEPPNACSPGYIDYVLGLSCDAGGRERTCDNQCTFGQFGSCVTTPTLQVVNVSSTIGAVASRVVNLPPSPQIPRLIPSTTTLTCPISSLSSTSTSFAYLRVYNPDPTKTATVAIYHSTPLNGVYNDSVMGIYAGSTPPANNDDTARKNCLTGSNVVDGCSPSFSGLSPTPVPAACASSSAGTRNVTIGPLQSIIVYSGSWSTGTGDLQVNVYTQSLL